jgi:hypothetical protein
MKLMQHLYLLFLVLNLNCTSYADEKSFLDLFWEWIAETKEDIKEGYTVDYEFIKHSIENMIDTALGTKAQPLKIKREIFVQREVITRNVIKELKRENVKNPSIAMQKARELTMSALVLHVGEKAAEYAQEVLRKTKIKPSHNPEIIVEDIKRHFIDEADTAINYKKDNYCSLCTLYGRPLKSAVEATLAAYLKPNIYQPPTPSAPPLEKPAKPHKPKTEDDIYEIYPEGKAEEIRLLKERDKLHREASCCICVENFIELGKRVTLLCGHSICPTCLFGQLYLFELKQCPMCRESIDSKLFSVAYLKRYVNADMLKEQAPSMCAKIDQYFAW